MEKTNVIKTIQVNKNNLAFLFGFSDLFIFLK